MINTLGDGSLRAAMINRSLRSLAFMNRAENGDASFGASRSEALPRHRRQCSAIPLFLFARTLRSLFPHGTVESVLERSADSVRQVDKRFDEPRLLKNFVSVSTLRSLCICTLAGES